MLGERDYLIFFGLLLAVILINVIPFPPTVRWVLFALVVAGQILFVYHGLTRGRK